jgi:alanyl-tRNA synthetase
VVRVGDFSMELCGGTHIHAAGDIGLFKIVQETGIAAGVRRIEAVTGARALELVQEQENVIELLAGQLKSDRRLLPERLRKTLERQKELERELESLQAKLQSGRAAQLLEEACEVAGVKVLASRVDHLDGKGMRELADRLRERLSSGVIVLGGIHEEKAALLVAVTGDLVGRLHAGRIIQELAPLVGGKGGGRPDLAQAGGNLPEQLPAVLEKSRQLVASMLQP